jgi:hypothetical protein
MAAILEAEAIIAVESAAGIGPAAKRWIAEGGRAGAALHVGLGLEHDIHVDAAVDKIVNNLDVGIGLKVRERVDPSTDDRAFELSEGNPSGCAENLGASSWTGHRSFHHVVGAGKGRRRSPLLKGSGHDTASARAYGILAYSRGCAAREREGLGFCTAADDQATSEQRQSY